MRKTDADREEHNFRIEQQYAKKELAIRKREFEMFLRVFERAEELRGIQWDRNALRPVIEEPEEPVEELQDQQAEQEVEEEEESPEPEEKPEKTIAELLKSLGDISIIPGENAISLLEDDRLIRAAKDLLANPEDQRNLSRLKLLEQLIEQINRATFRDSAERLLGRREKDRLEQIQQLLRYLKNWRTWYERVHRDISRIVDQRE